MRLSLIERLLQLLFIIRLRLFNFSHDLAEFLKKFLSKIGYFVTLSQQWLDVIDTQIKFHHDNIVSIPCFVNMLQNAGEPFVVLKRLIANG
jgi:hypothetical protein